MANRSARVTAEKRRIRSLLLAVHLVAGGASLAYSAYHHSRAEALYSSREASASSDYSSSAVHQRKAESGIAASLLIGFSLPMTTMLFSLRGPLRLILGNLYVLFFLLLLLEAGSKALGLHYPAINRPGRDGVRGLWIYDATLGWFHAPHATASTPAPGSETVEIRINSLGLRGPEIAHERGTLERILVFGDSFAFGVGVDEAYLATTRLQELLASSVPGGLEVINLGVSGYSTDQELLLLERLGSELDPDIVVLIVCDNDYNANSEDFVYQRYYKPYFDIDDEGELYLRNVPVPTLTRSQAVKLWLGRESNLWNFVRSRDSSNPLIQSFVDGFQVEVSRSPRRPYKTTRAIVSRFADAAYRLGAPLVVTSTGRRGENPDLFASLSRHLSARQIPHVDLLPVLEEARTREPSRRWDLDDGLHHWDRDGHELVAQTLAGFIEANFPNALSGRE